MYYELFVKTYWVGYHAGLGHGLFIGFALGVTGYFLCRVLATKK